MADAADSKSVGRKAVWVRLPPPAPIYALCFPLHKTRPISTCVLRVVRIARVQHCVLQSLFDVFENLLQPQ
jgi:hypothetical protein